MGRKTGRQLFLVFIASRVCLSTVAWCNGSIDDNIHNLTSSDPAVRKSAVEELGKIGNAVRRIH